MSSLFASLVHLGRYRLIEADPPWAHANYGQAKHGAAKAHYGELTVEQLAALPVADLADPRASALALWCTGAQAADGAHIRVADAWGFRLVTRLFTWVKVQPRCTSCGHPWEAHEQRLWDPPGPCGALPRPARCGCLAFAPRVYHGCGSYTGQGSEDVWLGLRGEGAWSRARARMEAAPAPAPRRGREDAAQGVLWSP